MPEAISPELERFVESEVASGRYASRDAVIAQGLQLLQRRDAAGGRRKEGVRVNG